MYFNIKCIGKLLGPTNEFERSMVFETGEFERPKFDCTYYSNFDYPKNSIFLSDSSVPITEKAIKLPFKIRSPSVTHGDHDFFVWSSSIYTPE